MKSFKHLLAVAALVIGFAIPAGAAAFIAGVDLYPAMTNAVGGTNALTVAASATTNLPTTLARTITLGNNGFGVSIRASAASTSLATNTLVFEFSGDGANWILQPTWSVFITNCTTTAANLFTNFPPTLQNNANLRAIRLKYITNSSAAETYFTNILIGVRQ